MENKIAHEFVERREKFFRLRASDASNNTDNCKVATQSLFNWVMASIESIYWSEDFYKTSFSVSLYAQNGIVILTHIDGHTTKELRLTYKQGYPGDLKKILKNFVKLFNNTNFHKHKYTFSDPSFHADGPITAGSSDFNGCYYVINIYIDMRVDIRDRDRVR